MNFTHTLMATLGMEIKTANENLVEIRMPVDSRTRQPMGFLHGGANAALAESAASLGAYKNINPEKQQVFGIEVNMNHLKSKREGWVTGRALPLHRGKRTTVWEIKISDEQEQLVAAGRCTIGIVPVKA